MSKFCCVCGREFKGNEPYCCVGPNTYTCYEGDCWSIHRWDVLAARYVVPGQHEYFVVNNKLYRIGSEKDDPQGSGGRFYAIIFEDNHIVTTRSLWFIDDVPKSKRKIFKQNAHFIQKGACGDYA